jgi:hypothetical protein
MLRRLLTVLAQWVGSLGRIVERHPGVYSVSGSHGLPRARR